jgi:hypothetical protein
MWKDEMSNYPKEFGSMSASRRLATCNNDTVVDSSKAVPFYKLNTDIADDDDNSVGGYALMVVYGNEETAAVFGYVTDLYVDEEGSVSFKHLARPSENLFDFVDTIEGYSAPSIKDDETPLTYFKRLEEFGNLELREASISAVVRWELRGMFEYNEKTGAIVKSFQVKKGSRALGVTALRGRG